MRTLAIILAAGVGKRMGAPTNKQLLLLDNKPIIVHTLQVSWHVAEISASDYAPRSEGEVADGNGRSSQNGRNGEESRWRRGNSSDRSSGSAAASATPSAISTAEQSEILRKLKERREKESQ